MNVFAAENIGKRYLIRHDAKSRCELLREELSRGIKGIFRKRINDRPGGTPAFEEFWALKDVSFEIKKGERVGIIGKNGAGKSTLLKILSRITKPTTGTARIHGRVASMLEVGAGFHPELTGRENVFLSGALLGMSRREIERKFDAIVAFAGTEKFLDTPVKHYSSGMYVRLAFAVSAHLEPEILIIDEVLSVGDMQFQKRCLEKMDEYASGGKTILLVSHNMHTVLSICSRCMLLSGGRLARDGEPRAVVSEYSASISGDSFSGQSFGRTDLSRVEREGNGSVRFLSLRMQAFAVDGTALPAPVTGCDIEFITCLKAVSHVPEANVALLIFDKSGEQLVLASTYMKGTCLKLAENESATVAFKLKNALLRADSYTAGLWIGANGKEFDSVRCATSFQVEARSQDLRYGTNPTGLYVCEFEHSVKPGGGS